VHGINTSNHASRGGKKLLTSAKPFAYQHFIDERSLVAVGQIVRLELHRHAVPATSSAV
jgi:hypothetical protein